MLTLHKTDGDKWAELPDQSNYKYTNFKQLEQKITDLNSKFSETPLRG